MRFAWRRATLVAAIAFVGAIAGALAGLLLGLLVGSFVGLPRGDFLSDAPDAGFDRLDLGLWFAFVAWIVGALVAAWLAHRRLGATAGLPFPVAVAALALLGLSTTAVSSGTADWYDPLVVFGAPPLLMGVLSGREPRTASASSP